MSSEDIKSLIEINKILIEKVEKQQKIINDQMDIIKNLSSKLEYDKKENKKYTKDDFTEYFNENMRFLKNQYHPEQSGYYCEMSREMFLEIVDYLRSYGIEPVKDHEKGISGPIYYFEGLMYTNLSLRETDDFLEKYFEYTHWHFWNHVMRKTLVIEDLNIEQLERTIRIFEEIGDFEKKVVKAFIKKIGTSQHFYEKYFKDGIFIGEKNLREVLEMFGYKGKMTDKKLHVTFR